MLAKGRISMTKFTRRTMLGGVAAVAVLGPIAATSSSKAAAPPGGKQAPGWYR